eukprot:1790077-Pleurochrysis_carterae.AAC.2
MRLPSDDTVVRMAARQCRRWQTERATSMKDSLKTFGQGLAGPKSLGYSVLTGCRLRGNDLSVCLRHEAVQYDCKCVHWQALVTTAILCMRQRSVSGVRGDLAYLRHKTVLPSACSSNTECRRRPPLSAKAFMSQVC